MPLNDRDSLMSLVELHERSWGLQQYNGRPRLEAIVKSPIVVFWKALDSKEARLTVTLHDDLKEMEAYFVRLLFRSNVEPPKRRVARIYKDGKQIIVKGVKIVFQEAES